MVFSFILQNDGPKSKIFWMKWRTKHTLNSLSLFARNGIGGKVKV
jgi:hypothetical protein